MLRIRDNAPQRVKVAVKSHSDPNIGGSCIGTCIPRKVTVSQLLL